MAGPKNPSRPPAPLPVRPKIRPVDRRQGFVRARRIFERLQVAYPDARCALVHSNPLELLVATILSAQSTDKMVNTITPVLFRKYRTAKQLANADTADLEKIIHSTGFFRNKSKSIKAACQMISEEYNGQVPSTMEELLSLPGVARKTANVILGVAYGIAEGVVVDTHVQRLAHRLDLSAETRPERIEIDLMKLFPRKRWIQLGHVLIHHGRATCVARRPKCKVCPVEDTCYSEDKAVQ